MAGSRARHYLKRETPLYCIASRVVGTPRRLERRDYRPERIETMTLKFITRKLANWQRYRAAVRELSLLSDRELADLGLSRYDIDMVARRSANL